MKTADVRFDSHLAHLNDIDVKWGLSALASIFMILSKTTKRSAPSTATFMHSSLSLLREVSFATQ